MHIGVQSKVISQEIQSGIVFVQSEGTSASLYKFRVHDKRRCEDTFLLMVRLMLILLFYCYGNKKGTSKRTRAHTCRHFRG